MRLALREALLAFKRSPLLSILGVTTIAFSLFAFGLFSLVALNIRTALRTVEERVEVRLREGYRDPRAVLVVADYVRTLPYVEDVRYGADWIEKLHRIRNIAAATGVVLGVAFAAVAIIIISASIRMTVLARAREIGIMRLVGATDGFVRRPFLIDGFTKGVLGGAMALVFTWGAHSIVSRSFLQTDFFPPFMMAVGVAAGAALGTAVSAMSVRRHLKRLT